MNEEDLHAYYASQASYGSLKHHNLLTDNGYTQDNDLSSNKHRTYYKQDKAIVAYKGTNPLSLIDLDADAAIALGTHRKNQEFTQASSIAKKARDKYKNVTTTGHSLGGTKAIESANDIGGKAIVFNPGTGLRKLKTANHKVYQNSNDIISSRVEGNNVVKSNYGGHSLDSFEDRFNITKSKQPRVGKRIRRFR